MALTPGVRLGVYEVVGLLGAGGMGEVYRARDTRLNRDVAIKVLPSDLTSDSDRMLRFEQEARAAAALNHPNILAVFDVGSHESVPFIVSELLEGETLREKLSHGALPVRKVIDIGTQLAHGLAAAHEKGIVHRDLKPENCFVTLDGHVKILDFGLAKLTQADGALAATSNLPTTPVHTQHGMVLGTLGYMAPEQVRAVAVDHRADIFAFGAVLYEMLSGQRAFRGETAADTVSAILKDDPADLPTSARHIPPALARITDRCLEKAPAARFQAASDLAFALTAISSVSEPITHDTPLPSRREAPQWRRSAERLAWIALAVALATGLALQLRSAGRHSAPPPPLVRFEIPLPVDPVFTAGASNPIVSPNGAYVAFGASVASPLWVRALDATESRQLPGTEGASDPFWAPDSRSLAFASQGTLKRVDISSGAPQIICDAPSGLQGATWNGDGTIIFAGPTGGLWQVRAAGGEPVQLTTPDQARREVSHRAPDFLPDGRRFLYLALPGNTVYLGSLDSKVSVSLLPAESNAIYAAPGYLLFFRQGSLLAQRFDPIKGQISGDAAPISQDVSLAATNARMGATVSQTGVLVHRSATTAVAQLQWIDRKGTVTAVVTELPSFQHLAISRDGKMAAVSRTDAQRDIWFVDLVRGVSTKFTSGSFAEGEPQWSPDGKELAFVSTRGGGSRVYRKTTSGEQETVIEAIPGTSRVEDWSADGRFLAYNFENDIWVMPLTGERKPFRYFQSRAGEDEPQFSPDARWMAYTSTESGTSEIHVRPFPGPGERMRFSVRGGHQPRWRSDGKELFYLALDGTLMAVDIVAAANDIVASSPRPLFKIEATISNAVDPYAVAPDGQRFLVANYPKGTLGQPIKVILNWTALLKK
jgi:eukaryotic-like serine/threonine-protein kinase